MIDNEVRYLAAQLARRMAQRTLNGSRIDMRAEKARLLELHEASKGIDRMPFETNIGKKGWHKLRQPSAGRRSGHKGDTEPNIKGFREDLRKLKWSRPARSSTNPPKGNLGGPTQSRSATTWPGARMPRESQS